MILRMRIEYITLVNFKETGNLDPLLGVFESFPLLYPKKWAKDDQPKSRKDYRREAMTNWIATCWDGDIPMLFGKKPIPYEAFWGISANLQNSEWKSLNSISWHWEGPLLQEHMSTVFNFSSSLASVVQPELGCVNLVFNHENLHQLICPLREHDLQNNGLPPVGVRTWMGPHVINQVGLERLKNCGGSIRKTNFGGIELDLIEQPWLAEFDTLLAARASIMANLEFSGAFGDYSRYPTPLYTPAPNWKPIPLDQ